MWVKDGSGLLGSKLVLLSLMFGKNIYLCFYSGLDAGIKLRPSEDELHELGPDFQSRWKDYFANQPDKPIVLMMGVSG